MPPVLPRTNYLVLHQVDGLDDLNVQYTGTLVDTVVQSWSTMPPTTNTYVLEDFTNSSELSGWRGDDAIFTNSPPTTTNETTDDYVVYHTTSFQNDDRFTSTVDYTVFFDAPEGFILLTEWDLAPATYFGNEMTGGGIGLDDILAGESVGPPEKRSSPCEHFQFIPTRILSQ